MWKEIKGYEGLYSINELGEVLSHGGKKQARRTTKDKILSQGKHKCGYMIVSLTLNSKLKSYTVHRLVAETFIENPDNKRTINHKNGIKTDNRVENLEWMTHSENNKHSFCSLNRKIHTKGKYGKDNHSSILVNQLTLSGEFIKTFAGQQEAGRQLKICSSHIGDVCKGKRYQAGGFKWEYYNKKFKVKVEG